MDERTNLKSGRVAEAAAWLAMTAAIAALVVADGRMPSVFSTAFFVPIALAGYRYHLSFSVFLAAIASAFSSPALEAIGVDVNEAMMPSFWLAWPAFYLFIAVMANQWASIQGQRSTLQDSEANVNELNEHNLRRERELETLSAIHDAVISGGDEPMVVEEITKRVAETCDAPFASITLPVGLQRQRPLLPVGFSEEMYRELFPQGAPFGEGVDGWAMLHRKVASARNVFEDPRYDKMRDFAALVGFVSAAAAPFQLDDDVYAALVIAYPEEHEFTGEELTRLERLAQQTELAIRSVRQRESLSRFAFDTAIALTEAIESRDPYTGGHCRRLADLSALTAHDLHMSASEVESIRLGAALHDMGKIVVPDSILKKPDKLTPEEYAIVKQHCYSGGQICKRVGFLQAAYPIVYHHHERWDGRGYPDGIAGERIPIGARIVAVMDAYDAMTTDRPYRGAMSFDEATAILKDGASSQWDPAIVDTFLQMLTLRPELQGEDGFLRDGGLVLPDHVRSHRSEEVAR
ncbi:MAG TPA: HD domain-containing phosphohydrolase [Dehalococcoidia bacterium]|nr:HD domain-containing phosphohydrolase [Dehalococcoidia bacterium]